MVLSRVTAGRRILKEASRVDRLTEAREVAAFAQVQSRWDEAFGMAKRAYKGRQKNLRLAHVTMELLTAAEEDVWDLLLENALGSLDGVQKQLGWCADTLKRDTEGASLGATVKTSLGIPGVIDKVIGDWSRWVAAVVTNQQNTISRQESLARLYDENPDAGSVRRILSPDPVGLKGRNLSRGVWWEGPLLVSARARLMSVVVINTMQQSAIKQMNRELV